MVHVPVSRISRKRFGPEKPFVKLWHACFEKLVLKHVLKETKAEMIVKFHVLKVLRFKDRNRGRFDDFPFGR